ncbi:NAD-binding lipoprotein [Streptomyces sp. B1I3]|uniref:CASTOR/POLLUX-related putative ion channel n=1 Tax=Streptomyces sp. B1I3 TaxID=3042264 RepID=UPI0027824B42|nr:NAD-binding lipoprotein [Streptomyces sp. B1I3]MDQ0791843.1 voltage-gated potassium channel Kch [Streptomyces sp. B1I3]
MQKTSGGTARRSRAGSARVGKQRQHQDAPRGPGSRGTEVTRRAPLNAQARYWFDNTLTGGVAALIGWLAVACLAIVVPVSAVLVWTDDKAPDSLRAKAAAVWRTVGQTLRLGGEVGSPLRIALTVLLALVALFYVSTLVSLITAAITEKLVALRLGHSTVLEEGHTVVLGWSAQIHTVVTELVAANANQRRSAIAVLADRDKTEMEEELRAEVGDTGRTRLICRNGRPADPAALVRVSPGSADVVLVLPRDEPDEDADIVKSLLSLRAAVDDDCPVRIVAVVRDERYRLAARLAAGPGAVVLEVDDITARLVSQCVRQPGLSLVYQELLDFAGDEFYVIDAPEQAGRTFGQVLSAYPAACVVGVVRADGAVRLNPPFASAVLPGDRLVVIAHDDDTAVPADDPAAFDESVIVSRPPTPPCPERLLLLGWNRRARRIVHHLSGHATAESVLHVVADGGEATAAAVREAATGATGLEVVFHQGDPTLPETVNSLNACAYDGVIVLGPDRSAGGGAPDDRALVTLLLLRDLERTSGRPVSVVTEMTDDRNRAIAPVGPGADFVVSGELIGLLMAQISQNWRLADVFEDLLAPGGNGIHLRPAGDYVREGHLASFATVVESAARRGECAIGYRSRERATVGPDHGIRVNPPKTAARFWRADDDVIVITDH